MDAASPEYFIEVLTDQPPRVTFDTPGRDTTVSPLEEAYVEIVAEDDFGLTGVELIYSINGSNERRIPLYERTGAPNACAGCHTDRTAGWLAQQVSAWRGGSPKSPPRCSWF